MSINQKIEASLLAFNTNDETILQAQLNKMQRAGIDIIHYDVMDNVFVPNTAFDVEFLDLIFLKGMKSNVHFMVQHPLKYIKRFLLHPCNCIIFHPECTNKLFASYLLNKIKKANVKCGLAFKPQTDLNKYKKLIKKCDYVTIMGVNPGFGGQKFMENETMNNLKIINEIKKELNPNLIIQLDGGVNFEVVKKTAKYVDNFISGSFLIKLENPKDFVETVKKI